MGNTHQLLFLAFVVASVQGVTYVSNDGTDVPGCGTGDNSTSCLTLAFAFNEAQQTDTITLLGGPFSGVGNTGLTLSNNKVLTITSDNSAMVDCLGTSRWLIVNQTTPTTIMDIIVANCTTTARPGGAAIYGRSGQLHVNNVVFINNNVQLNLDSDADGGAIFFDNPLFNITIESCTFTGNSARNSAINGDGYGGAVLIDGAFSASIIDCSFYNNRADTNGGAIYLERGVQNQPRIVIVDCFFFGNTAGNDGGAVYGNRGTVVSDCTFEMNVAVRGGGFALAQASEQFSCNYTANSVTESGGAVFIANNGLLTTSNGLFRQNIASIGGAIMGAFRSKLQATGDNFISNLARQQGGAISASDGTWTLTGVSITGNDSPRGGGLDLEFRHDAVISDSVVSNNLNGGDVNGESSGVYCADSRMEINNMQFDNNKFFCAAFPVLTRCNTVGDATWQDFCPLTDQEKSNKAKTGLIVGVVVGLVGLTLVAGVLIFLALYMKKKKYWLWSEVTVDDE